MARLFHRLGERDAAIGCLRQIARAQSMRRKLPRLEPSHRHPPLDDVIDRLRIKRSAGHIAPAVDRPKHAAAVGLGGGQPGVQCLHRPAGQIDDLVLAGAGILRPAKTDGERGEGASVLGCYRRRLSAAPCAGWRLRCAGGRRRRRRPSGWPGRGRRAGRRHRRSPATSPARYR